MSKVIFPVVPHNASISDRIPIPGRRWLFQHMGRAQLFIMTWVGTVGARIIGGRSVERMRIVLMSKVIFFPVVPHNTLLMYSKVYLGLDGIQYQPQGDDGNSYNVVGRIWDIVTGYPRVRVYQDLGGHDWSTWCASNWETVPHDDLWKMCGPNDRFLSLLQFYNLDFRGTPFEHRYNEYVSRRKYWNSLRINIYLTKLAEQERNVWGRHCEVFIPFKRPNPQGYQGMWGLFDTPLAHLWDSIHVHDTLESDLHKLKVGRTLSGKI